MIRIAGGQARAADYLIVTATDPTSGLALYSRAGDRTRAPGRARTMAHRPRQLVQQLLSDLTGPQGAMRAVPTGRLLLVAAGAPAAAAVALLHPTLAAWLTLAAISAAMLTALWISMRVTWSNLPDEATLSFPLLVCAALCALEVGAPGTAAALTAVLTLCFAYVGLTQRARVSLVLLPFAATTFVVANDGWSRLISIRLVLLSAVWLLLAALLAALTSHQRNLATALQAAAHTDVLTGVGNRREVNLRLLAAPAGTIVVLCDLDHFKDLNDTHGHLAGDQVLTDFGALLRTSLRVGDFAGRYGGEEFVLIMSTQSTHASDLASRGFMAASQPEAEEDPSVTRVLTRLHQQWATIHPDVTFSTGRATSDAEAGGYGALAAADRALYAAKNAGRNTDRQAELTYPGSVAEPPSSTLR